MRRYTFTEEQIAEINSACKAAANKTMAARLRILYLYAVGTSVNRQKAEIVSALKTATEERAAKKLKALWLRTEGWNLPEIAEATGIRTSALTQIIRKYQENGLAAVTQDLRKNNRPLNIPRGLWLMMRNPGYLNTFPVEKGNAPRFQNLR